MNFIQSSTTNSMRKLAELGSLKDRVALVTGGSGYIGNAICEALSEAGATVKKLDIKNADYEVDLADESAMRALPDEFEQLDILVNCAAFVGTSNLQGWGVPFEEQGVEAWKKALDVNLTAPFILSQSFAPLLKESAGGSIVNVGSIYGHLGPDWSLYDGTKMANPAAYAASKGGLAQLTRWLATTLGPDIRVNLIAPGGVSRGQPESFVEKYEERTPLKRMATEEDFKGIAHFLASDLSAYVTGQCILVDGGWGAW